MLKVLSKLNDPISSATFSPQDSLSCCFTCDIFHFPFLGWRPGETWGCHKTLNSAASSSEWAGEVEELFSNIFCLTSKVHSQRDLLRVCSLKVHLCAFFNSPAPWHLYLTLTDWSEITSNPANWKLFRIFMAVSALFSSELFLHSCLHLELHICYC